MCACVHFVDFVSGGRKSENGWNVEENTPFRKALAKAYRSAAKRARSGHFRTLADMPAPLQCLVPRLQVPTLMCRHAIALFLSFKLVVSLHPKLAMAVCVSQVLQECSVAVCCWFINMLGTSNPLYGRVSLCLA